jgi:hypothetical protein
MTFLLLAVMLAADTGRVAVSLEVRVGAAAGEVTAARSGPQWTPGPAFHASAAVAPLPFAALFVEYGQAGFGCRDGFCRDNAVDFTSRGVQGGVELSWSHAWLRAGVTRSTLHSRIGAAAGTERDAGDASTGWSVGAGAALPLDALGMAGLSVAPGLRYTTHGGALPGSPEDGGVGWIAADLGLRFRVPLGR